MVLRPTPPQDDCNSRNRYLAALVHSGIEAVLVNGIEALDTVSREDTLALALLDVGALDMPEVQACARRCSQISLPVIALVPNEQLANLDAALEVDDFLVDSAGPDELVIRAWRVLSQRESSLGGNVIRVGDLAINTANYDVSVKDKKVDLRHKEYELLLVIATNPGRVYTRETLLDQIWGYDYLGGARTVDVHIRRLRSKIEDAEHSYIETIRQVGYRFRDIERSQ